MGVIFSLILWFVLKQAGLFGLIGGVKTVEGMSVGGGGRYVWSSRWTGRDATM